MFLEILTPDKKLFSGDAEYVDVPGRAGRTGILKNHAPLNNYLPPSFLSGKPLLLPRDKPAI